MLESCLMLPKRVLGLSWIGLPVGSIPGDVGVGADFPTFISRPDHGSIRQNRNRPMFVAGLVRAGVERLRQLWAGRSLIGTASSHRSVGALGLFASAVLYDAQRVTDGGTPVRPILPTGTRLFGAFYPAAVSTRVCAIRLLGCRPVARSPDRPRPLRARSDRFEARRHGTDAVFQRSGREHGSQPGEYRGTGRH